MLVSGLSCNEWVCLMLINARPLRAILPFFLGHIIRQTGIARLPEVSRISLFVDRDPGGR